MDEGHSNSPKLQLNEENRTLQIQVAGTATVEPETARLSSTNPMLGLVIQHISN
jgi:hypothetical protein